MGAVMSQPGNRDCSSTTSEDDHENLTEWEPQAASAPSQVTGSQGTPESSSKSAGTAASHPVGNVSPNSNEGLGRTLAGSSEQEPTAMHSPPMQLRPVPQGVVSSFG